MIYLIGVYESGPIAMRFRLFSPGSKRTQNFPFRKQHLEFSWDSNILLSFIPTHKKKSDNLVVFEKWEQIMHIGVFVNDIESNGEKSSYLT